MACSSSAQITTRVLVLPKSSPTANFALLATAIASYGCNDPINAEIKRLRGGPFFSNFVIAVQKTLQTLSVVVVPQHEVQHRTTDVFRHDEIVRVGYVDF